MSPIAQQNKQQSTPTIQSNLPEKKERYMSLDRYLITGVKYLTPTACLSLFISWFAFHIITILILTLLTFKYLNSRYALEEKLEKYAWFRKLKFVLNMKKLSKQAKSINQTQVFLGKYLLNMPIDEDEDEVKSYNDIAKFYGKDWPYMVQIRDTKALKPIVEGNPVKCISSYAYLDLGRDERVQEAAIDSAREYSTGNHGPRMLCGNLEILEDLEKTIAKFFKRDAALVFSSGYLACMSVIAGLVRKNDLLLMDRLNHASLKAGTKLAGGKTRVFKHNNFEDAERIIKEEKGKYNKLVIVIEGIYSMDGDVGFLDKARMLADKYKGILILDEAHSLGTIGKTGHGTEEMYDYKYKADIICGTFTKSLSSVGGYIVCDQDMRDFYTFYAPGLVFSAPLSAYHCGAAKKAFEIIEAEPKRVANLHSNGEYLRKKFVDNGFNIGNTISCVVPVIFRDTLQCIKIHRWLLNNGYFTAVVMAPACPVTAPRFRITATSDMAKEDLDNIVDIFKKAREANHENPELKEILESL